MLKPDYIDIDKDGNTTESMKKAAKERDMNSMGGLLRDDREQYAIGGLSRILAKAASKLKGKGSKAKPTQKELEDELRQLEYEQQQLMEDNMNRPEGLVGARLDTVEEIADLHDDIVKDLTKYYPDSELLKRIKRADKAEGGPMSMDDQMKAALIIPMEEKENMSMESEMESEMPMESDDDMEDGYTRFIMEEALSEEEEEMLMSKLEQDEELAMIFDKVIDVAQEFAGSGPVNGPGSGVSDSIPARLSDGEFVFTAKAVEEIGADNLMAMMKDAEMKADERQGLVTGGPVTDVEDEKVVLEPEKAPAQQINITKETVDSTAIARDEEDMIGDDIKKSMLDKSRNI